MLGSIAVDWVVNCAGVTGVPNVDACEIDKQNTISGNAIYPALLHAACERRQIRFAHFSSGCIYQGNIDSVDATPNFFGSTYSISKGISDVHLKDKAQVYRIRMPFTGIDEPKNYLTKVLKYARTDKLIDSGYNSLTDLDEAVRVACDLIEAGKPNGYYNLVNSGSITMHELMDMFGMSVEWFTDEEFKAVTVAARSTCTIPAYEVMSDVRIALSNAITNLQK
jgi:dTDP-4-dehydrorhamnose reductase